MASTTVSYDSFAPRSSAQVARLQKLQDLTAGPLASQSSDSGDQKGFSEQRNASWSQALGASFASQQDAIAASSADVTTTESSKKSIGDALQTCDHLTTLLKHTTSIRLALRASIHIAEDLSQRHVELLRHSGELSAAADRLQAEESMLSQHAEEIGRPLQHYDAVDRIGVKVGVLFKGAATVQGLAKIKVDHDEYADVLDEIDDAVEFFGNECGGKEALAASKDKREASLSGSMEYFRRSLALQEAALFLLKEAVVDRILHTTTDVQSALNLQKNPVAADKLEASLIYTRFHGISARSKKLVTVIQHRKGEAYIELLNRCRNTFCASRERLLKLTVRSHMDKLQEQHGLVGMTRLASVFLIRLCMVETSLYLDFFGSQMSPEAVAAGEDMTVNDAAFQNCLNNLCFALHRTVRRGLVTILDLDTLCQIVSVLREEHGQASSSPTTLAAARAMSRVMEDAQERLIFCAHNSLQKEVVRFRAHPADLDYPGKLTRPTNAANEEDAVQKQLRVYESWFPPIRSVLRILSKIFRVVEPRVFEDIARESVQGCTRCLKDGAAYIGQKSGVMHSDLFLVKHLLILREQLSPFDLDLRSVERQLDFSDAGKAVSRFLANRNRRLFSMSTENALVTLLREGVSVQEASVDSKRDLEDALRSACNDFIEHTSQTIAGDMLAFGRDCKANDNSSTDARFNADIVKVMLEKTSGEIGGKLNDVVSQMRLYLESSATQAILLKPVSRKINRALEDARKVVQQTTEGANGWNAESRSATLSLMDSIEAAVKAATKTSK